MRTESCRDEHRARREELFGALVRLRDSPSPSNEHAHAWRVVVRHVHRVLPTSCEDERQSVLLALMESMGTLRATSPASAAAWLRTICRNQRVDAHRARHLGRDTPFEDGSSNASTGEPVPSVELAERVLDAFAARIDAYLATASFRPDWRARRRVQGIVALRRLALEETLPEISQRLGLDVSFDVLTKWVERGRAVILATIAHDRVREPDVADFFAPLEELALERRADAGRPRPGRRRRPS